MTTENPDVDSITAEPTSFTLSSGFELKVERLRTRATFALMKILTRGAGNVLFELSPESTPEEVQQTLIAAVVYSIPEAEDETIEFLTRMVSPANLRPENSKADISYNEDLVSQMREELQDPDLEDLVSIMTQIVRSEAPHMVQLGKRLTSQFKMLAPLQKSNSDKPTPQSSSKASSKKRTQTDS